MTGAAIVRRDTEAAVVLAVHGSFDGASAWALRIQMDEIDAREFVVDLTHAEEACGFAACLLDRWARERRLAKRVRFVPGAPEHVRLLGAWGLEVCEAAPPLGAAPTFVAAARSAPGQGALATGETGAAA